MMGSGAARRLSYGLAALMGLGAVLGLLGLEVVAGTGGLWRHTGTDGSQNLSGHLAFQADAWRWPLLVTRQLFWPQGLSVAMTDSNPLASLLAKAVAAPLAGHPVNLLGAWLGACWLLQPVAAVFALRGFGVPEGWRGVAAAGAAGAIALLWPTMLFRLGHVNLLGHFLLLAALGLAARAVLRPGRLPFLPSVAVLALAILTHPYNFLFAAAVLTAPLLRAHPAGRAGWWREAGRFLLILALPVLLFRVLSGSTGGADRGYGYYSMDLLSPVWPQLSGLFGGAVLDGTGGAYEGFNYLGAGVLLILALALALGWWRGWRAGLPLLILGLGLTAVAVTPRAYAGGHLVLPLPAWPWDQIFGIVRASGRAFWPVGYMLALAPLAWLARRLPLRALLPLLALALGLQAADAWPLLQQVHQRLAEGEPGLPPLPAMPEGMTLFRTAPVCPAPGLPSSIVERARLQAVRQGAALADIRASRQPRWFNCESGLSDALELPLRVGEVRLLVEPAIAALRPAALGDDATCRRQGAAVLCARGLALAGEVLPPGDALPEARLPEALGTGWVRAEGLAWTEGPRATLLFRNPGPPRRLRLALEGIGRRAGEARAAELRVNDAEPVPLSLPDLAETVVEVEIPSGPVRLAFDLYRPVDPGARGLAAPVRRAGLRLRGLE
ncbi:DUF6311 domain-containing protein [Pararoseomonas indoligenes]|uniref:DUF6311 domain-containing protein n=1 Tax=Roseomonas indoligenes TaxID=2820811 RepID=A0A940S6M4_9PROT|nr:DUF6311 domain-containing protein [Pararoseomonas indoligenes]MBP0494095.1 hypothetical protein [Pararoseomonas indoligenes]